MRSALAGVALLVVAIALALLGRAVLATSSTAAVSWPTRADVHARGGDLVDRAASSIVGADSSAAFDQIVAIYRNAIALQAAAGDPRGPVRITRLIPKLHSPQERAQALTMAGTLLAYSAGAGFGVILPRSDQAATASVLGEALQDFRAAVAADPANEAAKYDLELLLRQQRAQAPPPRHAQKRRPKPQAQQDRRRQPRPGNTAEHHAGIYESGSGY